MASGRDEWSRGDDRRAAESSTCVRACVLICVSRLVCGAPAIPTPLAVRYYRASNLASLYTRPHSSKSREAGNTGNGEEGKMVVVHFSLAEETAATVAAQDLSRRVVVLRRQP